MPDTPDLPGQPDPTPASGRPPVPWLPVTASPADQVTPSTTAAHPEPAGSAPVRTAVAELRAAADRDELPPDHDPADDPAATPQPATPEPTRERLLRRLLGDAALALDATPRARLLGWLWPLAVTALGGVLRFWRLGEPHRLVFDETYYVKQAYSLLALGFEAVWGDDANAAFEAGDTSLLGTKPEYVVHPPVGKWLIALGMHLGGGVESSFAWRLASAVAGTLAVLLVARAGRRLFASTAMGALAGLLLAVDGEAIVHSRTGLLDNFLMVFVLGAFAALLVDRERARRRLADLAAVAIDAGEPLRYGPALGPRWWRLLAAVLLGLATGTKWSGIYFVVVFGLMSVVWDATARRAVGVRRWPLGWFARDAVPAGLSVVTVTLGVYLATWTGWFRSEGAWRRQWAEGHPGEGVQWLPPALRSLWQYHVEMWHFHTTLTSEHTYAAHPLGWIVQWRPTSFFYPDSVSKDLTSAESIVACGAERCSQAITSLGNPVLWWAGAAALVVAVVIGLLRWRDWRAFAAISGTLAGWLPWFAYAHRTIFTFYSIAFTPWVVLTLVWAVDAFWRTAGDERGRRLTRRWIVGLVALIVVVSAFFYPIWTAWVIPYDLWRLHMWLPSWI